jgi:hypothetical protein
MLEISQRLANFLPPFECLLMKCMKALIRHKDFLNPKRSLEELVWSLMKRAPDVVVKERVGSRIEFDVTIPLSPEMVVGCLNPPGESNEH